uniref:C2 domain-containing protein n=1 Tax=Trichuris muris TaxID=70415 RepID=A0A5S6QR10_TRIMR
MYDQWLTKPQAGDEVNRWLNLRTNGSREQDEEKEGVVSTISCFARLSCLKLLVSLKSSNARYVTSARDGWAWSAVYRTEIYPKSLNPEWNSDWFYFEADDATLQDECLQLRVMDYDTYSANDAVGRVYIDLSPLLSGRGPQIAGWFPIYDTMHGIRGELNVIVKLDLFADISQFRESSCDIEVFATSGLPFGRALLAVRGFVDELMANNDPEYEWIDKIRTPRASNEARQTLFAKMAGQLMRRIGKKVSEMGGNAVIGYRQYFDFEGESGVVIRGNGTAVSLEKVVQMNACAGFANDSLKDDNPMKASRSPILFEVAGCTTGAAGSARPFRVSPCAQMHLSLCESQQRLIEYPFLTISSLPTSLLINLVGVVAAHSVKLIRNVENAEDRLSWWRELRLEIYGHMKALGCNAVVGYREEVKISGETCILSVSGTAAVLDFTILPVSIIIRNKSGQFFRASCRSGVSSRLADPGAIAPKVSKADGPLHVDISAANHRWFFETQALNEGNDGITPCRLFHIPPNESGLHSVFNSGICGACNKEMVPAMLMCTIDPPFELSPSLDTVIVQARVVRKKPNLTGEPLAKHISNVLPFAEHDLHSQIMSQTQALGRNAIFSLQREFSIGNQFLIILLTGTAVLLPSLANPLRTTPVVSVENSTLFNREEHAGSSKRPSAMLIKQVSVSVDSANVCGPKKTECSVPTIAASNEQLILLPADRYAGHPVYIHSTQPIATMSNETYLRQCGDSTAVFHHTFTRVLRFTVDECSFDELMFTKKINWIIKSTMYKFRKLRPKCLLGISFSVEIPDDDEVQITMYGVAVTADFVPRQFEKVVAANTSRKETASSFQKGEFDQKRIDQVQTVDDVALRQPTVENWEVFVTALTEPPAGGCIEKYVGYYDFFFIRETGAVREVGGVDSFLQMALSEIMIVIRSHVAASGGNGMVSFKFNMSELSDNVGRNQAQFLVSVSGDIVTTT